MSKEELPESRPAEMLKHDDFDPQSTAIALVRTVFYGEHPFAEPYIVWFANTLKNWKALVSTNVPDNRYYEITHNGEKNETYVDCYEKQSNFVYYPARGELRLTDQNKI